MNKYEYLWMKIRGNLLPADISRNEFSYEEIFFMSEKELVERGVLSGKQIEYFMSTKSKHNIDSEYEAFLDSDIKAVTIHDDEYPDRLRWIENRPYALFYIGDLPGNLCEEAIDAGEDNLKTYVNHMGGANYTRFDNRERNVNYSESSSYVNPNARYTKTVAIIGARNCTEYGRYMAGQLATELVNEGVEIVSGMAYGIDGIAQMAALEAGGKSYGVLGCGVDVCYPRANKSLYERLKTEGCLISEYPLSAPAKAENFPMRNRIISGLSDVVIVVEAKLKSGTFITVDYALSQGKEIMVVPGRATDPLSVGCNALISQGAYPAQSAEDVLRVLDTVDTMSFERKTPVTDFRTKQLKDYVPKEKEKILLEREENMVYSVLDFYSLSPEEISNALNLDIFKVMSILISLEMKGVIKEKGKNLYVKCR